MFQPNINKTTPMTTIHSSNRDNKNNYFMISLTDGGVMYEYGTDEQDVRMFMQHCYPSFGVTYVEQIN